MFSSDVFKGVIQGGCDRSRINRERLPGGYQEIRIRNNSAIRLVAFALYAKDLGRVAFADAIEGDNTALQESSPTALLPATRPCWLGCYRGGAIC